MSNTKNTNPEDATVEQKLQALYQLQTKLSEIDRIKTLRGELPLEVSDLDDEITGLKTRIDKYKADLKNNTNLISTQKQKIEASKDKIERYKEQLDNVRNNKEFDFLSKEIEFETLEIELAEKKIKEYTYASKNLTEQIENSNAILSEKGTDLEHKKSELDEIIAETKQQEEVLREEVKNIENQIEPRLLTAFKRIRKSARNGLAIVTVQRSACGGCFNKIPPQRQLDIKLSKKIIVCEYCGRIMVSDEIDQQA